VCGACTLQVALWIAKVALFVRHVDNHDDCVRCVTHVFPSGLCLRFDFHANHTVRVFCGTETHVQERYLDLTDIGHRRTNLRSPQTSGLVERFHRTVLAEFFGIRLRERFYEAVEPLQAALDAWLIHQQPRTAASRLSEPGTPAIGHYHAGPFACETRSQIVHTASVPSRRSACGSCSATRPSSGRICSAPSIAGAR
jgi:hypothetical protein